MPITSFAAGGPFVNPPFMNVLDYGVSNQARFLAACSITAGSRVVTCDAGALDGSEVGWTFEIVGGGSPDALAGQVGRQNWQGTVASVNAGANTFTAAADPPASSPTASGLRGTVALPLDATLGTLFARVAAAGGGTLRLPAGRYFTTNGLRAPSRTTIEGDGQDRTILRCGRQAPGVKCDTAQQVTVRDLTVELAGPDGGADGVSNATAGIDILNSSHVLVERVTVRYGAVGFSARMQATSDVTVRDCRAENITKSNGTYGPASIGGVGFWIFNCTDVHLDHCATQSTDRHGIYFDPGTSTGSTAGNADQHSFLDRCTGTGLHVHDACREGAGVGIGLEGVRRGLFSDLAVYTAGLIATPSVGGAYAPYGAVGAYGNAIGLFLGGDQNGEYSTENLVTGVVLRAIGGQALTVQGTWNTVRGLKVEDFNLKQVAATPEPAIKFESYGGYTAANVLAAPDVTDNLVDGVDLYYTGDPTLFNYAVGFSGGAAVPNGSGGTRTQQTLRNRVRNARLLSSTARPSINMASWAGAANCPSVGSDANWVGALEVGDHANSLLTQLTIYGDTFERWAQRADGRMTWGQGNVATDTNLYRTAAGRLGTDNQFLATNGLVTKVKAGAIVDGDFASVVVDGLIAVDSTNNRLYIRVGGVWRYAALT